MGSNKYGTWDDKKAAKIEARYKAAMDRARARLDKAEDRNRRLMEEANRRFRADQGAARKAYDDAIEAIVKLHDRPDIQS
ncbi:hypothetical protein CFBP4996_26430 (plasmid) [Agrobacterium leguminum]|uniref:hypothetical protein n=1 Tax=Agrobacterium leguminum TaxID=2792015 RepID=UPI0010C99FCD|nr:hypothetical protein [Agrobacterium leguminum]WFS69532.1 hypothetical protein CFBP4996_26430 [Agrobacterium leguminum]